MFGKLRNRSSDQKNQPKGKPFVDFCVIEPGNTSLRILIVEVARGQSTVWGWAEKTNWSAPEFDFQTLYAACEDLMTEAEEMARQRADRWFLPDRVVVGLAASQLLGKAWPVTQRREKPSQPIDERELTALLARGLRLAVNRLHSIAQPRPEDAENPWLLMDAAPVSLEVDGRGVTDPIGFRGREVGATVFAALTRLNEIRLWQQIAKRFEFTELTLTATPLALAAAQSEPQGVLVDVGGTATDLIWWRNGRPVAIDTLPVGGVALTDSLVREWHLSNARANRLKNAYGSGNLDEDASTQVLEAMAPTLQNWVEETELAMARLSDGWEEPLPHRLYLTGGGSSLPEFEQSLGTLGWSPNLEFTRHPHTGRMKPTDVPGVVNRTEGGRRPGDVAALALAAWIAREHRPADRPSQILNELCHE